ncbi:MAG: DUF4139 domain-containing protein [Polyangiaceae bacterium]|nr:DUF4139 domain-containing protein [Polyangiaceae bacterium]
MTSSSLRFAWAGALLFALGCGGTKPPAHTKDEAAIDRDSSSKQREKVSITVYNQNFGLVREIRKVPLGKGRVSLEYQDVSAHIQPETVHIKSLDRQDALEVLEQNYRYDLLSPQKLLEKYLGKTVKVYRFNEKTGTEDAFDAEVLAVEQGTVLRINGEVTYNFPGRFAFPQVPKNLMAKPTLVWLLTSGLPEQRVEVSYLTQNLTWKADYVMVVGDKDERGDLTGWVTLTNGSGTSYESAELKLVAGDVQRVRQAMYEEQYELESMKRAEDSAGRDQFQQESFFEYHLYTLGRKTDLLDKEQKQVTLLEARDVGIQKKLVFFGASHFYRSSYGEIAQNQKVGVFLDLKNTKKNGMGMPLPAGIVRVYKADSAGAKQFIGEDRIDHTPRDEEIRIKMGEAFDVVGDRKQMEWRALGNCVSESSWEIELRNHKDEAIRVDVVEPIGGDWELVQQSHKHTKKDSNTFVFDVAVPARGKTQVTYRVRVRWC